MRSNFLFFLLGFFATTAIVFALQPDHAKKSVLDVAPTASFIQTK